ncbi:MAG TPA: zinc-dependent metalloprotease family protein, partial [Thermoanaerobaculia bacterium]|nr:zinc-dependent metalloprotease family protein [Thermoanaerobaculia bacterium]
PNMPEYCSVSLLRDLMTSATMMSLHNVWNAFNDQQIVVESVSLYCPAHVPVGGDLTQDLNWVANDPNVAAQRGATRSDLVSAVVPSAVFCGLAFVNYPTRSSDARFAFSVVRFDCMFDDFSLAHEIGHNLGMNHDRFEKGGGTASDCNYGFTILQNGNPAFVTVMAYDDFCKSVGVTCGRAGIHSNPEMLTVLDLTVQYGIDCSVMQTGNNGSANNVGQLQKAAPVAAGWQ